MRIVSIVIGSIIVALSQVSKASLIISSQLAEIQKDALQQNQKSIESIFVSFWDYELKQYHMNADVGRAIGQIDNSEFLSFLSSKNIKFDPSNQDSQFTSKYLVAYLRESKIGDEATYSWIELYKGKPDFVSAVHHWQIIQKKYGFEFEPTFFLLTTANLITKRDAQEWSNIFSVTFNALPENDTDTRTLMGFCLSGKIGKLDEVGFPITESFAFLDTELEKLSDTTSLYAQTLAMNLYLSYSSSDQYLRSAELAKLLEPKQTGLYFCFISQIFGGDLSAAKKTMEELSSLPSIDQETLDQNQTLYKEAVRIEESNNRIDPIVTTPVD